MKYRVCIDGGDGGGGGDDGIGDSLYIYKFQWNENIYPVLV